MTALSHPDQNMVALGIRQPWVELILRGIKTIEVRSWQTVKRGPIYLYASKKVAGTQAATAAIEKYGLDLDSLPRGVLVGSVELVDSKACQAGDTKAACVPKSLLKDHFAWRLQNPQRLAEPLTVRFLPYGVWFYPFKRRNAQRR